jgi:coenzyme PQQ biosynthesis probable peptidase PqqF
MPASNPSRPHTETLANGLRVTLRHAPHLKRCAAVLRVNAGSHDVPLAWPGLAHFLEHLLFLGTERFPAGQGLMAYVQGHGGQVNARTNERTTDFFVELPPALFSGGLERLSDMLAHPRMNLDEQLREREVLHAEYVAWSQDATAQQQHALFEGLSATHPLRGFHAGNRDSLAVERPEFQRALQDFHQHFYQAGQMTLSLAGPQSLEDLKALAEVFAQPVAKGEKVPQTAPAALMQSASNSYQLAGDGRADLLFAFEALPGSSREALAFLCHWLNAVKPAGFLAELRKAGLAEQLTARPLYQFAGQALLHLGFTSNCRTGWAFLPPSSISRNGATNSAPCCNASSESAAPCAWRNWTANRPGQATTKRSRLSKSSLKSALWISSAAHGNCHLPTRSCTQKLQRPAPD